MIRHKRTIEQKFKAIVAMIVAMGLVSGFTLQDGTINSAWSLPDNKCTICKEEYRYVSIDENDHDKECNCASSPVTEPHTFLNERYAHVDIGGGVTKDYLQCDYCDYIDTTSEKDCKYEYTDTSAGKHLTHKGVCIYCGDEKSVDSWFSYKSNGDHATHEATCNYCGDGTKVTEDCTPATWHVIAGNMHSGICTKCGQTVELPCTDDADGDGFCDSLEKKGSAAKDKAESILDEAKKMGWKDTYHDGNGQPNKEGKDWAVDLHDNKNEDYEKLYKDLEDYVNKELKEATQEGGAGIGEFEKESGIEALWEAIKDAPKPADSGKGDAGTPLGAGPDQTITIDFLDITNSSTVSDGAVTFTQGTTKIDYDLSAGYTFAVTDDTTKNMSVEGGSKIVFVEGKKVTVSPKTAPASYNTLAGTYSFVPDYSTPGAKDIVGADGIFEDNGNGVDIYFMPTAFPGSPYPDFSVQLFKNTTVLSSGSIKFISSGDEAIFNVGDTVKIGTPPDGSKNIQKVGKVIYIAGSVTVDVEKADVPPAGCEPLDEGSGLDFTADPDATATVNGDSNVIKKADNGKGIKVYFKAETKKTVDIKFFDSTDTGMTKPLTTGSLDLYDGKTHVEFNAGDTVVISNSSSLSKTGKVISVKDGVDVEVTCKTAPIGYKPFPDGGYEFTPDYSTGKVSLANDDGTFTLNTSEKEIDIFFEEGTEFTFTASGEGKPSSVVFKIIDAAGNVKTTTSKLKLGDGTYTLTATAAKIGYSVPVGKFVISSDSVEDPATSPAKYVNLTTVELVFPDKQSIDDVDFVKYPKKDGKDKPDTDADKLTGWAYKLQRYAGTEEKPEDDDDDDNWKDVVTVKPSTTTGTKYTLDGEKIYANTVYRMKETTAPAGYEKDSKYIYIKFDEDGSPSIISGKADVDDNEVQMYDVSEDEDSDDVIAVHKVDNAGTELAGAHLQIYAYTDSNTLVYGSSSSASTSANSTTSSAASVTASIGDEDENTTSSTSSTRTSSSNTSTNRTSSASTTKAKTTPTKPTVATSSVIVDWTSGTKGYVIDIDKLEKGKNYTLREVSAPLGYETPPYDFVFKYGTDGKLSIVRNYNGLLSVTGNKLVLKNQTPTEAAATRPKTGDHSKLALWLDICIVMLGGLYLSGFSVLEAFTEKKKVKVVAKKKPNNRRRR